MKAVIIEDDINHALEIEMILDKLNIEVVYTSKSWKSSLAKIKKLKPDIVIVDVFLNNNENGLELAKKLDQLFIPFIVCTGFPSEDFSDKALELGAYAYFSKPLDKSAFAYSIKQFLNKQKVIIKENYLPIKDRNFLIRIPLKEIKWLEVKGNYTSIVISSGKQFVQKYSLKYYLGKLNNDFQRVQRSYIINTKYIESINLKNSKVYLEGKKLIPIGNKYKATLIELFS